jgi:Raf-like Ras-binding domain.
LILQLKKSRSDAEDRHRKSLLPWHRKNRSKSKDRGESEYSKQRVLEQKCDTEDTVSVRSDVTSSRSSLASWDLALRGSFSRQSVTSGEGESSCTLCRVILPDGATTVVQTRSSESVRDLVLRLLDKRGLRYSAFEVFFGTNIKVIASSISGISFDGYIVGGGQSTKLHSVSDFHKSVVLTLLNFQVSG